MPSANLGQHDHCRDAARQGGGERPDRDLSHEGNNGNHKPMTWNSPMQQERLGLNEKQLSRNGIWALVGRKLAVRQQRALAAEAANCTLGCSSKAGANWARGMIVPLRQAPMRRGLLQLSVLTLRAAKPIWGGEGPGAHNMQRFPLPTITEQLKLEHRTQEFSWYVKT